MRRSIALLAALGTALAVTSPAVAAAQTSSAASASVVVIEVESGRGDLVSGGDALLRVTAPDDVDVTIIQVTADGRDVTEAFRDQGDGTALGLVAGLEVGESLVRAEAPDGRGARIALTNAPQSGPVFSGPLIEPWTCTNGSSEPDCSQEPTVTYHYRSTDPLQGGIPISTPFGTPLGSFQDYDPSDPPNDVATTDHRRRRGGAVHRPRGDRVQPARPVPDRRALGPGPGCDARPHRRQPGVRQQARPDPRVQLRHRVRVGRRTRRAASRTRCRRVSRSPRHALEPRRPQLQPRDPGRVADHDQGDGRRAVRADPVHDRQRLLRRVLVQQQVANAYPGVYQGITPQCSFTDAWSSAQQYVDYVGLRDVPRGARSRSRAQILPGPVAEHLRARQPGQPDHLHRGDPQQRRPVAQLPRRARRGRLRETDNPDGVRCSFHDYMRNVFGAASERRQGPPTHQQRRHPVRPVRAARGSRPARSASLTSVRR